MFDGEEIKKVGEQFAQSSVNVVNHFSQLLGFPTNNVDVSKNFEKLKTLTTKGIADVRQFLSYIFRVVRVFITIFFFFDSFSQLETELGKLRETVRKNLDPKVVEKFDELEKELKKQTADAKVLFDDKVAKPINDKYKDDVKKISEALVKSTKDIEVSIEMSYKPIKC